MNITGTQGLAKTVPIIAGPGIQGLAAVPSQTSPEGQATRPRLRAPDIADPERVDKTCMLVVEMPAWAAVRMQEFFSVLSSHLKLHASHDPIGVDPTGLLISYSFGRRAVHDEEARPGEPDCEAGMNMCKAGTMMASRRAEGARFEQEEWVGYMDLRRRLVTTCVAQSVLRFNTDLNVAQFDPEQRRVAGRGLLAEIIDTVRSNPVMADLFPPAEELGLGDAD